MGVKPTLKHLNNRIWRKDLLARDFIALATIVVINVEIKRLAGAEKFTQTSEDNLTSFTGLRISLNSRNYFICELIAVDQQWQSHNP